MPPENNPSDLEQKIRFLEQKVEKAHQELEHNYRLIFNSMADGFAIADFEGRFVDVNPSFCKMYGYKREELIGFHAINLIHPDYHPIFADFVQKTSVGGHFFGETIDIRKDGSTMHVEARGGLISIYNRTYLFAMVRDVTQKKEVEALLRQQEQFYRSLFENNQSIMLLIDPENADIMDANPSACTFYGYDRDTLKTMKITDINIFSKEEVYLEMERAKLENRDCFNFKHRLSNGAIRDVEVFSGPIEVRGKQLLCSIIHDVSERKRIESEREQLIGQLQSALSEVKKLQEFLPICASCKKIRDDTGYWKQIEVYLNEHAEIRFSHGICPECTKRLYPQINK